MIGGASLKRFYVAATLACAMVASLPPAEAQRPGTGHAAAMKAHAVSGNPIHNAKSSLRRKKSRCDK